MSDQSFGSSIEKFYESQHIAFYYIKATFQLNIYSATKFLHAWKIIKFCSVLTPCSTCHLTYHISVLVLKSVMDAEFMANFMHFKIFLWAKLQRFQYLDCVTSIIF